MKAKVIIENGKTEIVLTPENAFEIDVIDKVSIKKDNNVIKTIFTSNNNYGRKENQRIVMTIEQSHEDD